MKKILLLTISMVLFASVKSEYLGYTNKLLNYNFKLSKFSNITSPFFKKKQRIMYANSQFAVQEVKKTIHISLISILNYSAFINVETFIGEEKVKEYKKWVKVNMKVGNCIVKHIYLDKIILKCDNKIKVKKLNKKLLKIRVEK